jgi:hypothetical protein
MSARLDEESQATYKSWYLVREADGVEPSLIGDIPSTVHVVNSKTVALGPVTVKLSHIVVPRRVRVRRLEVLRLVEPVGVCKLDLAELLLARRAAEPSDLGDVAGITCKDGDPSAHGGNASSQADRGHARDHLRLGRDGRLLLADHDGLLAHEVLSGHDGGLLDHGGLLDEVGLLGDNIASLNHRLRSGGLLDTIVSISLEKKL